MAFVMAGDEDVSGLALTTPSFRRVLLKLSGEAFAGAGGFGLGFDRIDGIARQLVEVVDLGVQTAVVVGGGNILRGTSAEAAGMDRARADYMGMLATVMNSLALQDALERRKVVTRVQTAIQMTQIAEPYIPRRAMRHLEKGRIVIFGAGMGTPYFSTDTTAAQRALEIGAEVEAIRRELKVMDTTALSLCKDNDLPIIVFDLLTEGNIRRAVCGEPIGTVVGSIPGPPPNGAAGAIAGDQDAEGDQA